MRFTLNIIILCCALLFGVVGTAQAVPTAPAGEFSVMYDDDFISVYISPDFLVANATTSTLTVPVKLLKKDGNYLKTDDYKKVEAELIFSDYPTVLSSYIVRPSDASLVDIVGNVYLIPPMPSKGVSVPPDTPELLSSDSSMTATADFSEIEERLEYIYASILFIIGVSVPIGVIYLLYRAVKGFFDLS